MNRVLRCLIYDSILVYFAAKLMKKRRLVSTVKKVKIPPTESNEKFEGVAPVPLLAGGGGGAITTFH